MPDRPRFICGYKKSKLLTNHRSVRSGHLQLIEWQLARALRTRKRPRPELRSGNENGIGTLAPPGITYDATTALCIFIGDWPSSLAICRRLQPPPSVGVHAR